MATKVTKDMIKQINELYLQYKTYAAVAREVGISAGTVKKYVIPNYETPAEIIKFEGELPPINIADFQCDWSDLLIVTPEEEDKLKVLWKEITL